MIKNMVSVIALTFAIASFATPLGSIAPTLKATGSCACCCASCDGPATCCCGGGCCR